MARRLNVGLNGLNYYSGYSPLLNWWKTAGEINLYRNNGATLQGKEVWDAGIYLNTSTGELLNPCPANVVAIERIFWAAPVSNAYAEGFNTNNLSWTIDWEGTGTAIVNNLTIANGGTFIFGPNQDNTLLRINVTNRNDPPRNIRVYQTRYADEVADGEIFNPHWIKQIRNFGVIRVMDWMATNFSEIQNFSQFATEAYYLFGGSSVSTGGHGPKGGMPLAYIAELANITRARIHVCIPHRATNACVDAMAQFFKDNIDAGLIVVYEYSNEVWNDGFIQAQYAYTQGTLIHSSIAGSAAYAGYRGAECMKRIGDIYTPFQRSRWRGCMAVFVVNPWLTEYGYLVGVNYYRANVLSPANSLDVDDLFDEIAVTGYYGSVYNSVAITNITRANPGVVTTYDNHGFANGQRVRLFINFGMVQLNNITATVANATATTFQLEGLNTSSFTAYSGDVGRNYVAKEELFALMDKSENLHNTDPINYPTKYSEFNIKMKQLWLTGYASGMYEEANLDFIEENWWIPHKTIADANGLDLVQYEGNLHFLGNIWFQGYGGNARLTEFIQAVGHSEENADVFEEMCRRFRAIGGLYPSKFVEGGSTSRYGPWGGFRWLPGDEDNIIWSRVRRINAAPQKFEAVGNRIVLVGDISDVASTTLTVRTTRDDGFQFINTVQLNIEDERIPWYEEPEWNDYAVILDFNRNRYALPALNGSNNPILTRVNGAFPKRPVSFEEAITFSVQHSAVIRTSRNSDGTYRTDYSATQPRFGFDFNSDTQQWLLRTHNRFNRIIHSENPTDPFSSGFFGNSPYRLSFDGTGTVHIHEDNLGGNYYFPGNNDGSRSHHIMFSTDGGLTVNYIGDVTHANMDVLAQTVPNDPPIGHLGKTSWIPTDNVRVDSGWEHAQFTAAVLQVLNYQNPGTILVQARPVNGGEKWFEWQGNDRTILGMNDGVPMLIYQDDGRTWGIYNRYHNVYRQTKPNGNFIDGPLRVALAWTPNSRRASLNGSTILADPANGNSVANGLTLTDNVYIGHNNAGATYLDGFDGGFDLIAISPESFNDTKLQEVSALPNTRPVRAILVGHSLVNFTMPHMLDEISPPASTFFMQIINGAPMEAQWNDHLQAQGGSARNKLMDSDNDVFIITERSDVPVEYHNSFAIALLWRNQALNYNPNCRIFIYQNWHEIIESTALQPVWRADVMTKLPLWEEIARQGQFPYIIPGGLALVELYDRIQVGQAPGFTDIRQVFDDGIHMNNVGNYFIACVFYASIYRKSPVGLNYALDDAYNNPLPDMPSATQALTLQTIAWDVVYKYSLPASRPDTVPNAFDLGANATNVEPGDYTSRTMTVTGINYPAPISVSGAGAQYRINSGAWTSAAGIVNNNDTVNVRIPASATLGAAVTATLTISGISDSFTVTTKAAPAAPNKTAVRFQSTNGFMPPNSAAGNTTAATWVFQINLNANMNFGMWHYIISNFQNGIWHRPGSQALAGIDDYIVNNLPINTNLAIMFSVDINNGLPGGRSMATWINGALAGGSTQVTSSTDFRYYATWHPICFRNESDTEGGDVNVQRVWTTRNGALNFTNNWNTFFDANNQIVDLPANGVVGGLTPHFWMEGNAAAWNSQIDRLGRSFTIRGTLIDPP